MTSRTILASVILVLIADTGAFSGVISRGFLKPDDGLLTYDNQHEREWLDFAVTKGKSLEEVQALLLPGGILEGFEFASRSDVAGLTVSANVLSSVHELSPAVYLPGEPRQPAKPHSDDLIGLLGSSEIQSLVRTENLRLDYQVVTEISGSLDREVTGGVVSPRRHELGDRLAGPTVVRIMRQAELSISLDDGPRNASQYSFSLSPYSYQEERNYFFTGYLKSPSGAIEWSLPPDDPLLTSYWLFREASSVPEPLAAWLLLLAGGLLATASRRR